MAKRMAAPGKSGTASWALIFGLLVHTQPSAQEITPPLPEWLDAQGEVLPPTVVQPEQPQASSPSTAAPAVPFAAAEGAAADATAESVPFATTALAREAAQALRNGNPQRAFRLLADAEAEFAGDVQYDRLYGLSALEAGAAADAVLPLRRAVLMRPRQLDTRFDLARAHFAASEFAEADREFTLLLENEPPPAVREAILSYRDAIAARNARYQRVSVWQVSLEAGQDSNANSATALQNFAGFTLADAAREQDSLYYGVGGSGRLGLPLNARWRVEFEPLARVRDYPDFSAASRIEGGMGVLANYERGTTLSRIGLRATQIFLDGESNARLLSLESDLGWRLGAARAGVFGRVGALRFPSELRSRDVDQYLLGGNLSYGIPGWRSLRLTTAVLVGRDEAVAADSPNSRDALGINQDLTWGLSSGIYLSGRVGLLEARYDDPFFGMERDDTQLHAGVSANFALPRLPSWGLQVAADWLDTDSSVDFFSYDRIDVGVTVQREFK